MGDAWEVREVADDPDALHRLEPEGPDRRQVLVMRPIRPAVVLGSTQSAADVEHEAAAGAGMSIVRRRSGGGAVLVEPDAVAWVDVVVPRDDRLWDDDVGRSAHWFGEAWAEALVSSGAVAGRPEVHRGGLVRSVLSPVLCFAGLGPGEVVVDGCKVVGVSQRRTRGLARLQSSALVVWDPSRHARVLRPGIAAALDAAGVPSSPTVAVGSLPVGPVDGTDPAVLVDALVAAIDAR